MDNREQDALVRSGTVPGITDTAETGSATAGGGLAVPPDNALQNSGTLGDTSSMDDMASGNTSVDEDTSGADRDVSPVSSASGAPASSETEGDAPTGGLSSTGTIGGSPSGATAGGLGENGL